MKIVTQRIYAGKQHKGYRALVDRLWPRGISKQEAGLDGWYKDIAPSTELRTWFKHEKERWPEFRKKYLAELKHNYNAVQLLLADALEQKAPLILLYSAKNEAYNHALVLKDYLEEMLDKEAIQCASPPCLAHEVKE